MNIALDKRIVVDVKPEEMAKVFYKFSAAEQAAFFNRVGDYYRSVDGYAKLDAQMASTSISQNLKDSGRIVMNIIGVNSGVGE